MIRNKRVAIIGGGPAGLAAAYTLLTETNDCMPIVFEESGEIGGISRTVQYKGNRMDLGGHRFFTKNEEVMNLWLKLMPLQGKPAIDDVALLRKKDYASNGVDPEQCEEVMLIRDRISRIYFLSNFFDYPLSIKYSTFANMGFVRTVKAGFGYVFALLFKRKENSLEDFYINRFGKPLYVMFFEDYTEKVWGLHPSKISPDWGSQRVKGLSLLKALGTIFSKKQVETSLIERFYYPKRGPGQLYETMAREVERLGGEIRMNAKVVRVNFGNNTSVEVETSNGTKTVKCDYVISSMPVKDLVSSLNENIPAKVKEVAAALPYRDFITVGLLLNKLKIKNSTNIKTMGNIVPDCWIYIQERSVKLGRIQIFNNWSPYMVKDLENTVWIGLEYFCSKDDELWNMDDKAFIKMAAKELASIGIIDESDVLDSCLLKVKKAYPAYFGAYDNFSVIRNYLDTIPNLFLVGRNGQHRYNNMDHSMLTGIEAARAIKNGTVSKDGIWNVNTEEDYHEQKSK